MVRAFLEEELSKLRLDTERECKAQQRRRCSLEAERQKLLNAHYADAIPLDLLKSEQARLTAELANAESRLAEIEGDFRKGETNLQWALRRAGDCQAAYREASGRLRRQFNLAFFKRLLIDDEGTVTGELAEPFKTLLGDDLRRAAAAQASEELRQAVEEALRQRAIEEASYKQQHPPESVLLLVGAGLAPAPFEGGGFSAISLVGPPGLEPGTNRL